MLVIVMGMALFSIPVIIGTRAQIDVLPVLIVQDVTQVYPADQVSALSRSAALLLDRARWPATDSGGSSGRGRSPGVRDDRRQRLARSRCARTRPPPLAGACGDDRLRRHWPACHPAPRARARFAPVASGALTSTGAALDLRQLLGHARRVRSCAKDCATASCSRWSAHRWSWCSPSSSRICRWYARARASAGPRPRAPRRRRRSRTSSSRWRMIAAFGGPPFGWNGTLLILLTAYVVMYFPQAVDLLRPPRSSRSVRPLIEASSDLRGLATVRTLRRVLLPLMTPALISAWALIFVLMSGDITASAMLASTRTPVVGFVMLDQWTQRQLPDDRRARRDTHRHLDVRRHRGAVGA